MTKRIVSGCLALLLCTVAVAQDAAAPQFPQPQKEHEWLKQLAGEWDAEGECVMGPGQPPMKMKATITGRTLGAFWAMTEIRGDMAGTQMTGVMTVGYDPEKKKYVGTWVDSMTNHLWHYTGSVDESGKKLTLEAVGPDMTQPGKKMNYRDVWEVKDKDHIVMTSACEKDGKWFTFATNNLRRKK